MIGNPVQRDGVRKELPRIALNRQVLLSYLYFFFIILFF
jgi:hypothetical protein